MPPGQVPPGQPGTAALPPGAVDNNGYFTVGFMKTEADAAPKKSSALAGPALTVRPYPMVTPTVTGLGFVGTF